MKVLIEKEFGGDGGKVGAYIDAEALQVKVSYPLIKVIQPATNALDGLLDKLKAAIPGTWDDALIDKLKDEYKADLVKFLAE